MVFIAVFCIVISIINISIYGALKSNREEFIKKARVIHSDKYDYSKVEYINR